MFKRIIGILVFVAVILIIVMAVKNRKPAVVELESEDAIMEMMGYDTLQVVGSDTTGFVSDTVSVGMANVEPDSLERGVAEDAEIE